MVMESDFGNTLTTGPANETFQCVGRSRREC